MPVVSVRLSDDMARLMDARAQSKHLSRSDYLAKLIQADLDKKQDEPARQDKPNRTSWLGLFGKALGK